MTVKKVSKETLKKRRNKLVKTLKEGKYRQCEGKLCKMKNDSKTYTYCCLGVACRVYEKETGKKISKKDHIYSRVTFNGHGSDMPQEVQDYFGFKDESGGFDDFVQDDNGAHAKSLIALNDTMGWTFTQIGDFIKSNPKGMFV